MDFSIGFSVLLVAVGMTYFYLGALLGITVVRAFSVVTHTVKAFGSSYVSLSPAVRPCMHWNRRKVPRRSRHNRSGEDEPHPSFRWTYTDVRLNESMRRNIDGLAFRHSLPHSRDLFCVCE